MVLTIITIFIIILSTIILSSFSYASIKKLNHIIDLQRQSLNLSKRESKLQQQEIHVILRMLVAELQTNQSKLEAYITIYQETLSDLNNTQKEPRYRKLGDMIQMQPSLRRDVYVKNTHKLKFLGDDLAARLVQFYTGLCEDPEYKDIEPDDDITEIKTLVKTVLENGHSMNEALEDLLQDVESKLKNADEAV